MTKRNFKADIVGIGGKFIKDKAFMQKNEIMLKMDGFVHKIKIFTESNFKGKIKIFYCRDVKGDVKIIKKTIRKMGTIISEERL